MGDGNIFAEGSTGAPDEKVGEPSLKYRVVESIPMDKKYCLIPNVIP